MKYVILTNFDDYNYSINCDEYGVINFVLTPNYKDSISLKQNFIKKTGKSKFDKKYCTIYKKSDNELLFKYTNHKNNNTYNEQKLDVLIHNIPRNEHYLYYSNTKKIKYNYYYHKLNRLNKKTQNLRLKLYY